MKKIMNLIRRWPWLHRKMMSNPDYFRLRHIYWDYGSIPNFYEAYIDRCKEIGALETIIQIEMEIRPFDIHCKKVQYFNENPKLRPTWFKPTI